VSDIDIVLVDRLKVLDPKRPIREADIVAIFSGHRGYLLESHTITSVALRSGGNTG
jgi:hypothetical protein